MKNTRSSNKKRINQRKMKPGNQLISHPPEIQEYAVRHGTRLRFVCNSAVVAQSITFQNLLDTMVVATTAVQGADLFYSVKVRAVEVWAAPVLGTAVTVAVDFSSATVGVTGDQRFHTDTSMGIEPAHVRAVPSRRSVASLFQTSSGDQAFTLSCPTGAVIDLELTFVQTSQTGFAVLAQNALVGATAGAPYWRGFDGLAIAGTKFTPVANAAA